MLVFDPQPSSNAARDSAGYAPGQLLAEAFAPRACGPSLIYRDAKLTIREDAETLRMEATNWPRVWHPTTREGADNFINRMLYHKAGMHLLCSASNVFPQARYITFSRRSSLSEFLLLPYRTIAAHLPLSRLMESRRHGVTGRRSFVHKFPLFQIVVGHPGVRVVPAAPQQVNPPLQKDAAIEKIASAAGSSRNGCEVLQNFANRLAREPGEMVFVRQKMPDFYSSQEFLDGAFAFGRSFFLKPCTGAAGIGILKVERNSRGRVEVKTNSEIVLDQFGKYALRDELAAFFTPRLTRGAPFVWKFSNQEKASVWLDKYMRRFYYGSYDSNYCWIVEEDLKVEKINGQRVELRLIMLPGAPGEPYEMAARYAKLSYSEVCGNIACHGWGETCESALMRLFAQRLPHLSIPALRRMAEIELVSLENSCRAFQQEALGFLEHMKEAAGLPGTPTRWSEVLSIDLVPVWSAHQKGFDWYLMEAQGDGENSMVGIKGLKDADPAAHDALERRLKRT